MSTNTTLSPEPCYPERHPMSAELRSDLGPLSRFCCECGMPLYLREPNPCVLCWDFEINAFQHLLALGSIGGRIRGTTITR